MVVYSTWLGAIWHSVLNRNLKYIKLKLLLNLLHAYVKEYWGYHLKNILQWEFRGENLNQQLILLCNSIKYSIAKMGCRRFTVRKITFHKNEKRRLETTATWSYGHVFGRQAVHLWEVNKWHRASTPRCAGIVGSLFFFPLRPLLNVSSGLQMTVWFIFLPQWVISHHQLPLEQGGGKVLLDLCMCVVIDTSRRTQIPWG